MVIRIHYNTIVDLFNYSYRKTKKPIINFNLLYIVHDYGFGITSLVTITEIRIELSIRVVFVIFDK
jgi:hypothetical protein